MNDVICSVCDGTDVAILVCSEVVESLDGSFVDGVFVATGSVQEYQDYTDEYSFCNDCKEKSRIDVEW